MFNPDITIWIDPNSKLDILKRIQTNSGTFQIDGSSPYCLGRIALPKDDWSYPSPQFENSLFNTDPSRHYSRQIGIISIPQSIYNLYVGAGIQDVTNLESLNEVFRQIHQNEIHKQLMNFLVSFHKPESNSFQRKIVINGFSISPPGLKSLTVNGDQDQCRVGLHIDSWDKLDIDNRTYASNRISINFSREIRYLLTINLSMEAALDRLAQERGVLVKPGEINPSEFVILFLEHFATFPVCRIALAPGEAYIAPTENMIHDGSSEGMNFPSVSFTIRGTFSLI